MKNAQLKQAAYGHVQAEAVVAVGIVVGRIAVLVVNTAFDVGCQLCAGEYESISDVSSFFILFD
jgi:hypothetical protein